MTSLLLWEGRKTARRLAGCCALMGLLLGGPSLPAHAQTDRPFEFARPGTRRVAFSFNTQRNLIIVAARLNGRGPYHFLLDTGVSTSLLTNTALADSLHLVRGQEMRVLGAGGEATPLRAYYTEGVRVELPGLVAPHMSWLLLSEDALNLSGYVGTRIDGILGAELFRSLVVGIWPARGQLVCHDPARYRAPRGRAWVSLPLYLAQGKAYVTTEVQQVDPEAGGPLPVRLVLDTGAGHALSLETSADPRLCLPSHCLQAELGRGLGGVIRGHLGRVAGLQLGRYRLAQVLTSFPDAEQVHQRLHGADAQRQGNLGYELLKRFNTIIDYPHQRLLLHPNPSWRTPFEHDMCGLDLLATGPGYRQYLVMRVVPGSPAEAAGITADEELLTINFLPVSQMPLTEVSRLLRAQDGLHLLLVLRQPNGDLHPVSLRLRRQI